MLVVCVCVSLSLSLCVCLVHGILLYSTILRTFFFTPIDADEHGALSTANTIYCCCRMHFGER